MLRAALLFLSERETPERLLTRSRLGRRVARRFIAGEEFADAARVVRALNAAGLEATLDHLGESVREPAEARSACGVYLEILDRIAAEGLRSHVSVKLTQLGLAMDESLAAANLRVIAERAAALGNFVRVDMEGSAYTEKTLRVFRGVNAPRDALGIAIQSYLHRSERDVEELVKFGARIRLVKGAYREPPEVAFPRKADVDASFERIMERMMASGGYHAIATHDSKLIAGAKKVAASRGLARDAFEFQMLYGIRSALQRQLARQGFRVRIYVPYGGEWYPYFMRRLAERPANVMFLLRNVLRG